MSSSATRPLCPCPFLSQSSTALRVSEQVISRSCRWISLTSSGGDRRNSDDASEEHCIFAVLSSANGEYAWFHCTCDFCELHRRVEGDVDSLIDAVVGFNDIIRRGEGTVGCLAVEHG